MVTLIDNMILPDEELGQQRNPESFDFGEDSDAKKRSPSPSPSRKKKPKADAKAGGRKPITKKRRRVKRKTRVSRRKY